LTRQLDQFARSNSIEAAQLEEGDQEYLTSWKLCCVILDVGKVPDVLMKRLIST